MAEEYQVLYDWAPENADELSLTQGDTILVLDKPAHGWWSGLTTAGGARRGYFPSIYVQPLSVFTAAGGLAAVAATPERRTRPFSIDSLDAFDALIDTGVAVEIHESAPAGAATIHLGSRVTAQITALAWDGSTIEAFEFAEGTISFTVGLGNVPEGLEEGVKRLHLGDRAAIICAPQKGYGSAGFPPYVPPASNLVYFIHVTKVEDAASLGAAATTLEGSSLFASTGVATKRPTAGDVSSSNRRISAQVVLDLGGSSGEAKASRDGGTEISDEMLARAAEAMGISAPAAASDA